MIFTNPACTHVSCQTQEALSEVC